MQPDFSALFRTDKIAPLHFRVRPGACAAHDVQFLSSYLHDARFTPRSVTRRGKKVFITLQRDCWEFGYNHASEVRSAVRDYGSPGNGSLYLGFRVALAPVK
jgi:hypothetical protein